MPVDQPTEVTFLETGYLLSASIKDLVLLLVSPHASITGKEIFTEPAFFSMLLTTLPTYVDVQGESDFLNTPNCCRFLRDVGGTNI